MSVEPADGVRMTGRVGANGLASREWASTTIGDVSFASSGTTPARSLSARYYEGGTVPWAKTLDLNNSDIWETDERVTPTAVQESSLRVNAPGSVLVAMYGGFNQIGRTGLLRIPAAVNQAITAVSANKDVVDPRYLLNVLNYNVSYWRSVASSSRKDPNITREDIRRFPLELPPLDEQRAIADALGDVDALLDALNRQIAKQRDLKQAAMQQLLTGRTRVPGFTGEWLFRRIGDIASIRSGGTPSTGDKRFWNGNVPWCTPTDITALAGRKHLEQTERRITNEGLAASSAELIPARSIIMTSRATIGECAINVLPVATNQGFKNLVLSDAADTDFLYYLLGTQKQQFIRLCGGSTFLELSKAQLAAYELYVPATTVEQTAIAAVLSDMDAEISALSARRAKTRDLKQAMLQELLTGRTRLV